MAETDTQADDFISRWQDKDGTEQSNLQLFLTELCELLAVDKPVPAAADNTENAYVFERRVDMAQYDGQVNRGFIDLYRRDCFVLEGKQSNKKLDSGGWNKAMLRAYEQADAYIRAMPVEEGKPPFLIVTDVGRSIELFSEFSRSGSTYIPFPDSSSHRLKLEALRYPETRAMLAAIWADPESLDPSKRSAKVTRAIANHLAGLAKSLEKFHSAEVVGTFLMRCLFTMFAEDVGLLPKDSFTDLLERLHDKPESFAPAVQHLWTLMNAGGYDGVTMEQIKRFNGGLFADASALKLSRGQIQMLYQAARSDWQYVEPAIFGTLLERAL
ncbi:MAG: SAM-dependent methyltransferase, partial [uncultured Thiotrichaceae bacterium]